MNRRRLILLKYLLNNASEGFKIYDIQKIMSLSKHYKNKYDLICEDIKYLSKMKYIDVKYIDELNVCLSVMGNSLILQESIKNHTRSKKHDLLIVIVTALFSGIMSFVGCVLAIFLFGK